MKTQNPNENKVWKPLACGFCVAGPCAVTASGGCHLNFPKPGAEADWLFIPPEARQWDFSRYKLSERLLNILGAAGIVRLGDLNGLQLSQLIRRRNLGRVTVLELLGVVRHLQHGNWNDHSPRRPSPAAGIEDFDI